MQDKKYVSFFTDISKNIEFIDRLKSVLAKPDSSIMNCSIAPDMHGRYTLFLNSFADKAFSSINFNFIQHFDERESERALKGGFSQSDVDDLTQLFDDFCFENGAEALFFISKFVRQPFVADGARSLILKRRIDPSKNAYFLEGMHLQKYYSLIKKEQLAEKLKIIKDLEQTGLIPFDIYNLNNEYCISTAISQIKTCKIRPFPSFFILEYFVQVDTGKGFLENIYFLDDENLEKTTVYDVLNG